MQLKKLKNGMKNKITKSYNVNIWVGLKEGYEGPIHTLDDVYDICSKYVNTIRYCVTVTPTKFLYVDGFEDGVNIGFINYPRFPNTKKEIRKKAFALSEIFLKEFKQYRISVTTPNKTYLIENKNI